MAKSLPLLELLKGLAEGKYTGIACSRPADRPSCGQPDSPMMEAERPFRRCVPYPCKSIATALLSFQKRAIRTAMFVYQKGVLTGVAGKRGEGGLSLYRLGFKSPPTDYR